MKEQIEKFLGEFMSMDYPLKDHPIAKEHYRKVFYELIPRYFSPFESTKEDQTMEFKIPRSLKLEHEELHTKLAEATRISGEIGDAAKVVAKILHPHFVKEEEYALPPLGLLPMIAEGKVTPEMGSVISMTDRLKSELNQMLEEHKEIVAALKNLTDAAKKGEKTEYAHFAEKLMLHAQNEEEVLYPAAILIGEYLKLKLNK